MIQWLNRSEAPVLRECETHIWRINLSNKEQLERAARRFETCLSAEESDRAARFHFLYDRIRFVIRRAVLRHLMSSYLDVVTASVDFVYSANGKPDVSGQNGPDGIRFNCSQSAGWGLIAIAQGRDLGIDVEYHQPLTDIVTLANTCFSREEIYELTNLSEAQKTEFFYKVWTCKEAFVKAIGRGLSFPLNDISISSTKDGSVNPFKIKNNLNAHGQWTLLSLDVAPGYSAALVHENQNIDVKFFEYSY